MSKSWQKAVKVIAFLLVLALCYAMVDQVLKIKTDDMESMVKLRQLPPDTVDVLLVGSSHIGMNIDNQRIFDEYGIASYNLWVGMQPIWNSYYYLKEAFRYQKPKVVMVDVFLCGTTVEYSAPVMAMKNIELLPFGLGKVQAALDSFESWTDAAEAVWGMPYYHDRYDELTQDDLNLRYGQGDLSLFTPTTKDGVVTKLNILDYNAITDTLPLTEKNERYLKKTIELCKEQNAQLILLVSPYEATEEECMRLNSVAKLAEENGVVFLNCLKEWDTLGIDPETDFCDIGHLNNAGIAKYSTWMGAYLQARYPLRDCRTIADHVWNSHETKHQAASRETPLFMLAETFHGDGVSEYLDTGVSLYGNRYGSWTLLTRVDMNFDREGDQIFLSCFNEEGGDNFRGLILRGDRGNIQLILGANAAIQMPTDIGDEMTLAIAKDGEQYTVYVNGVQLFSGYELSCDAYAGTLLLGCEELAPGGEKFRFSPTRVLNLEVYGSVLSESEILAWQPENLPEAPKPLGVGVTAAECVYTMPEQFVGGNGGYRQASYLDTQTQLFASPATRFTLLTSVTPVENAGSGVFLSCFDENVSNYRGLLIRQLGNAQINIVFGQNQGVTVQGTVGTPMHIAVVKDVSRYRIYADGALVAEAESPADAYDGTLLLGAQRDADGNIFRVSQTSVSHLSVYAGVLPEAEIGAYAYADALMPQMIVAESAAYALPSAFVGNGTDRALDTGIKLYDVSTKDWTLETVIEVRNGVNNGVYLSCFSEEIGHYRGLMIRQDSADTITVYVGASVGTTMELPQGMSLMHLVLVKSGSQYTLWRDGALVQRIESACDDYDATLLLGAQRDADGHLFRFSNAGVRTLNIVDGALSDPDAAALSAPVKENSRF